MRKIEREMIQAIIDRRCMNKANTKVVVHHGNMDSNAADYRKESVRVYLHGNWIAEYTNDGKLSINHQGWKTNTTKSRLNALIQFTLGGTCHLGQRNFEWFLFKTTSKDADTYVTTSTPIPDGWLTV